MPREPEIDARAQLAPDELLNHAPCGFVSFADDGTIRLINATLLRILGYDAAELIGRHVETLFTVGTRIFYQTHFFPLLRLHGGAEEIFLMLRSREGEEVGVLVNAMRRERGGSSVYDCIVMRVRERQKYETELLRARQAAEQSNRELQVQKRELQLANEQLSAQALELEEQQQQLQDHTVRLEAAGEELRLTNETLQQRSAELERLRSIADEANQAKSAFLAVMSHELRTPLNAIAGYVELIDMGIHGPVSEAQHHALSRITRSQRHLLRLINDILNLSRIEAGRVDYMIDDVALDTILDEVAPMVEPQMSTKELRFERRVAPGLVVRADREKVQQILLNLLSNAIKFTPAGGSISVAGAVREEEPGTIDVLVRDTGMGIPAEKAESVFEPFVQVDVNRASRREGTGLGLAISRDLARGMGGDLRVRSELGRGSTFTLSLPRA